MRADINVADRERRYQVLLGWTETSSFKTYVNNNLILNCNITVNDINRAEHIYGGAKPTIRGKTRKKKPKVHSRIIKIPLPLPI